MTVQAILGGDDVREFSTTTGHGDFIRWARRLDVEEFPLTTHLADWGWVNEIALLPKELSKAMQRVRPHASLKKTLDGFLVMLENRPGKAESVMLSSGLSSEDQEDGEWWIDGKPVADDSVDSEKENTP